MLRSAGYAVDVGAWGIHNTVINSITKDGVEHIPFDRVDFGFVDPRAYLPKRLVVLLDKKLPAGEVLS